MESDSTGDDPIGILLNKSHTSIQLTAESFFVAATMKIFNYFIYEDMLLRESSTNAIQPKPLP